MSMTSITIENTNTTSDRFLSASEAFWATSQSDEFAVISFDRSVDWLLDLYQLTDDQDLRLLITEVLEDLRAMGPVEGEFEDIVLGALASVEIAFEIKMAA